MHLTPGQLFEQFKFTETPEMEALAARFQAELDDHGLLNAYRALAEAEIEKLNGHDYGMAQIGLDVRVAQLHHLGGDHDVCEDRLTECSFRAMQEGYMPQAALLTDFLEAHRR